MHGTVHPASLGLGSSKGLWSDPILAPVLSWTGETELRKVKKLATSHSQWRQSSDLNSGLLFLECTYSHFGGTKEC